MPTNQQEKETHHTADVGEQRVASVYAEALLNVAEKHDEVDALFEELTALVHDVFAADGQLENFLSSGAIGRYRKADAIEKTFQNRAGEVLINFLLVLNEHERLDLLRPMLSAYEQLRDQRARRVRVKVQSATALSEDQQERLKQELSATLQMEPMLETTVEPELLGGMVVRVGDWLFDGSVKTRLEHIRNQIIERSSHEIQSGRDRFSTSGGN